MTFWLAATVLRGARKTSAGGAGCPSDFAVGNRARGVHPIRRPLSTRPSPSSKPSPLAAAIPAPAPWRKLVKRAASDPGNLAMNVGAVLSLSGFMMSDVMALRALSISGSLCGIAFNASRKPPLYNAVAWGLVFVGVNAYHLYYLYLERNEDTAFHGDEMLLYSTHFKEKGVEPWQFKKLVKVDGCRFRTYGRGDVIVKPDEPLDDVLMVVRGEVAAEDKAAPPLTRRPLYTYRGDGKNGCVVGGTALVDPLVRLKDYPNRLTALEDGTVVAQWDADQLVAVMESDKDIESAMLHALYIELIQGLRRDRKAKGSLNQISDKLLKMEGLIQTSLDNARREDGGKLIKLRSEDKKAVRVFAAENKITASQRENLMWKLGWSPDEWDDGEKRAAARG